MVWMIATWKIHQITIWMARSTYPQRAVTVVPVRTARVNHM